LIVSELPLRSALVEAIRAASGWSGRTGESVLTAERLLATVHNERFPGAIIPRFQNQGFTYYLAAETGAQWRKVAPLVDAFVGRTISDFEGVPSHLSPADPFESILLAAGLIAARITPAGTVGHRRRVAMGLLELVTETSSRERPAQASLRSTASLLRDFDLALVLHDRKAAEGVIAQLRSDLRLEGLNHVFMQIEAMACAGDWSDLWRDPYLDDAAKAFRPPRVTLALLRATYWAQLDPYVARGDVVGALGVMTEDVLPRWGDLAAAEPTELDADVCLPLLLASAARGTQAWISESDANSESWPGYQREFVLKMAAGHGLVWLAASENEPAVAFPEPKTELRTALISAALASAAGSLGEVLARLRALPVEELDAVLDHPLARKAWELVAGEAPAMGIQDWFEWAVQLPSLGVMEARVWAREAISLAPVEQVLVGTQAIATFSTSLLKAGSQAESTTTAVLPVVLDWLSRDPDWPRREYVDLYRNLMDILLLAQETNALLVAGVGKLMSAILGVGLAPSDYRMLCRDLSGWVGGVASLTTVDALVDLGESTVSYPCPDVDARAGLWGSLIAGIRFFEPRLDPIQVAVIKNLDHVLSGGTLASDFGVREPDEAEDIVLPTLRGRVAIYTLVESVARRVQESIEAVAPDVRVDFATDKVGNDRLLALARDADVFAIDWSRAKHAATDFIRDNRGNRPVLFTSGSGSSSIAREILEALRQASRMPGRLVA